MRPGYIRGASRLKSRLGSPFGETKTLKNAINLTTNEFYEQDTSCPEGQKSSPAGGCKDDLEYMPLPEPPPGGFLSCDEWNLFGYPPSKCNKAHCPTCFGIKPGQPSQPGGKPGQPGQPGQPANVSNRSPLALPFKGSCPKTHFQSKDAMGVYCKPCNPGQIWNPVAKKCQTKPAPCPCGLPRQGDPDFGKCTPPPRGCGPAPKHQKCNVPGYGPKNLICKCGKWMCPTTKDLLIQKFKAQGKAVPKGVAGYTTLGGGYKKPLIGLVLVGLAVSAFLLFK